MIKFRSKTQLWLVEFFSGFRMGIGRPVIHIGIWDIWFLPERRSDHSVPNCDCTHFRGHRKSIWCLWLKKIIMPGMKLLTFGWYGSEVGDPLAVLDPKNELYVQYRLRFDRSLRVELKNEGYRYSGGVAVMEHMSMLSSIKVSKERSKRILRNGVLVPNKTARWELTSKRG